jgi:ABC-type lipoprotein export system ATPase subunit
MARAPDLTNSSAAQADDSVLVDLRQVGFEVTRPTYTRILHPIDLTLARRASLAVVGPSGAGKTTLASIIGALQRPTEGSYRFAGQQVDAMAPRELAAFRAGNLGFVFQNAHLIDERSAWRNVSLGLTDSSLSAAEIEERSRAALDAVGLGYAADREAALLSGGERQRVAVARALVKRPQLVIADEPTGAVDQKTGMAVLELLFSLTDMGTTLIIVSHDMRAADLAERCVTIVDGRLEAA